MEKLVITLITYTLVFLAGYAYGKLDIKDPKK